MVVFMHIIHKQLYQWDKCVDFNRTSGMVIYYKNNVYCGFAGRKTLIVLTYNVTITASKQLAVFCIRAITFFLKGTIVYSAWCL